MSSRGYRRGRTCPCGCNKEIEPGSRRRFYESDTCRARYHKALLDSGNLVPVEIVTCENPKCSEVFPRYREIPFTMKKKYCGIGCSKKHRTALGIVDQPRSPEKYQRLENKGKRRSLAQNRRQTCYQNYRPCIHYGRWMEEPDLFCCCTGYIPEPARELVTGVGQLGLCKITI